MENKMVEYIREQPVAMRKIFEARKALMKPFVELYVAKRPNRIYLTGSGTSYNSTAAAAAFMQEVLGIEVFDAPASQLPSVPKGVNPLFMIISQGGRSTNSIASIEAFKQYSFIAITGEADSLIAQRYAANHLLMDCGEELAGPKTKGYTSSILTFYLCALEGALAAGDLKQAEYDAYIAKIDAVINAMPANVEKTFAWYQKEEDNLVNMREFVVFGKGVGSKTALESALKLLETVKYPAMPFEFEEYLHGPIMMADDSLLQLGFISPDEDGRRMVDVLKYYRKYTPCSYSIMKGGDIDLDVSDDVYMAPFAHILPGQVISALLPARMGREEGGMNIFVEVNEIVGTKAKD